ncbi:ribonuclease H-like domain-containing protein, partial [bacterium]|nr:ribonuclease H-like domain-containing protein [bacterium]
MRGKDQSRLSKDLPEIRKQLSSLSRDSGKPKPQEPRTPEAGAQPSTPGPEATDQKPTESAPAPSGALGRLRRRVLSTPRDAGSVAPSSAEQPVRLEDALPGLTESTVDGRCAYHIHRTVRQACPEVASTETDFAHLVRQTRLERFLGSKTPEVLSPEQILFLDLETTGLDVTPLFLIGTMAWEGDGLVVRQFFARDYDEEPAVLSLFLERYEKQPVLVTFNGRSYDLPYVRMRARATKVPFHFSPAHLDLLIEARKV